MTIFHANNETDTVPEFVVWGVGTPRTLRVHWMMAELGLSYQTNPVRTRSVQAASAEFGAITVRRKIPVLQHRAFILTESAAILWYLADLHSAPSHGLVPQAGEMRARCQELSFFILSELDAASLYIIRRHDALSHVSGAAPTAISAARDYFTAQMRAIELLIDDGRPYLVGPDFSVADILLGSCLAWAGLYQIPLADPVNNYASRLFARRGYVDAVAKNDWPR